MSILKESWIYKTLLSFVVIIENAIKNSGIYSALTKEKTRQKEEKCFTKIENKMPQKYEINFLKSMK